MAPTKAARIPSLIYGTAWKKDKTQDLVRQAIRAGFRGIDTAAQPKHYEEDLVGNGIRDAIREGKVTRHSLYVQSKFTSVNGQDPSRLPYDPRSSITEQINTSVASSLHNLRHKDNVSQDDESAKPYLDCLVLHSPLPDPIQTAEAWQAMESHVPQSALTLGISNIYSLPLLQVLCSGAKVKPSVVQNRFFAGSGYDQDVRTFCQEQGITYQSFWTLTANPGLLSSKPTATVAAAADVPYEAALYGLVLDLGKVSVLDGTANAEHMKQDLDGVQKVQEWAERSPGEWGLVMEEFRGLLVVEE